VRPEKELKGFAKIALEPGEAKTVTFTLDKEALEYYDDLRKQWVAEPGEFEVLVGASSRDIRLTARFEYKVVDQAGQTAHWHIGLPLRELLADANARAVLAKYLGEHVDNPMLAMVLDMSLEQLAPMAGGLLTPETLQAVGSDLAKI
jgi:beta-glucosidase